jgi:hypothetical protein
MILAGNMTGRAWAFDSITTVPAGADGYASGMELEMNNSASDQPLTATNTTKNGIHLVGEGSFGGTAGLTFDGKWHDGVVCGSTVISSDCVRVWNGVAALAEMTAAGQVTATSFKLLDATGLGGVSTATFPDFCFSSTGTAYLGMCLYGANNFNSAQYSLVGGNAASDMGEYGRAAFAASSFGHAVGDSQWGWRTLSAVIATSGSARLVTQYGAAPAAANTIPIGAGRGISLDCKLTAHRYGGQDTANWSLDDALFDEGSTAATARMIAGSWSAKNASAGASGLLTPSIAADTTLGSVNISLTAASGGPWDVTARCFTTEAR